MNSTVDRSQYPRSLYNTNARPHMSVVDGPTESQQNLIQSAAAQTPDLPYGYDVIPSNYRFLL